MFLFWQIHLLSPYTLELCKTTPFLWSCRDSNEDSLMQTNELRRFETTNSTLYHHTRNSCVWHRMTPDLRTVAPRPVYVKEAIFFHIHIGTLFVKVLLDTGTRVALTGDLKYLMQCFIFRIFPLNEKLFCWQSHFKAISVIIKRLNKITKVKSYFIMREHRINAKVDGKFAISVTSLTFSSPIAKNFVVIF